MATTYTKSLKTLTITLVSGGDPITVADTASVPAASQALAQFLDYKTMTIPGENNGICYIPFHAVVSVCVTTSTQSSAKPDTYGCD